MRGCPCGPGFWLQDAKRPSVRLRSPQPLPASCTSHILSVWPWNSSRQAVRAASPPQDWEGGCEPLGDRGVSLLTLSPALRRPCSLHLEPCTWAQSQHRDAQVFQVTTSDIQVFRVTSRDKQLSQATTAPRVKAPGCPWVLPAHVPATGWIHPVDDSAPRL